MMMKGMLNNLYLKYYRYYNMWNIVIASAFLIYAILIPLDISCGQYFDIPIWLHIIITILFTLDFLIEFSKSQQEQDYSSSSIWDKGRLILDLLAAVPFFLFFGSSWYLLFRMAKIFKIQRLFQLLREHQWKLSYTWSLTSIMLTLILLLHWIASGWMMLRNDENNGVILHNYADAYYWTITTVTTVGYGDIIPKTGTEKLYAAVTMLIGFTFYGILIGNVISLISSRDPAREQYNANIEKLSSFSKSRGLPTDLRNEIYEYYKYKWQTNKGFDESVFLHDLPSGLSKKVTFHLRREAIEKIDLFADVPDKFTEQLALMLEPKIYTPGEFVFYQGDSGSDMYFIISGNFKVMSMDEKTVYNQLTMGQYFGEIALFENTTRTASVQATDYSHAYRLTKEDFDMTLNKFPAIAKKIEKIVDQRQSEL